MPYLGNEVAPLVQALEGKELKLDSDGDTSITADTDDQIDFKTGGSDRVTIDSNGNVGVGTTSPTNVSGVPDLTVSGKSYTSDGTASNPAQSFSGDTDTGVFRVGADTLAISTGGSERMRIESGHLLIGTTNDGISSVSSGGGINLKANGAVEVTRDDNPVMFVNRATSDGDVLEIRKDGTTCLELGSVGGLNGYIEGDGNRAGFEFGTGAVTPRNNSASADNAIDLGHPSVRFDDIYATNGTIQTSDENEKQDIASVTAKELNVAKKLSALFKTFRWKDKVTEKGDKARTHTGIVAQEVQSAFKAEGLDASNYGLFTSDTWWEKEIKVDAIKADEEKGIEAEDAYTYMDRKDEKTDGYTERTRLGVRYPELFSFIFSSIEARLTALESK